MNTVLVQVPYHLGRRDVGMANGVPVLAETLTRDLGAETIVVEPEQEFRNEIAASMDVVRAVAERVREVTADGAFPLVLAGNCNSSLGTVAGLGTPDDLGVVWFDAHGDFNTPETTTGGFFDGMALAMLTGSGWAALRTTVERLRPVDEASVVHVGGRDFDPAEEERLDRSHVRRVPPGGQLEAALDALATRVTGVYVHVDLDVLDLSEGRANWFACEGGLTAAEIADAIEAIATRSTILAAALTAYQPDCDAEGRIPGAAALIAGRIVGSGVAA
jgi:arginase